MRVVNGLFCVMLILFALVQYNDPDALFWFAVYALAAGWCGLAAFMPQVLISHGTVRALFLLTLLGALAGTIYFWPGGTNLWSGQVIWDDEPLREGLGMAVAAIGLLSVLVTWWRREMTAEA